MDRKKVVYISESDYVLLSQIALRLRTSKTKALSYCIRKVHEMMFKEVEEYG